jgi:hypothetical protein
LKDNLLGNSNTEEPINSGTEEILPFKTIIMKAKKTIAALLTSLLIMIVSFTTNHLSAQTDAKNMKECCMMKEGKMMHCKDGKTMPMEKDMTMANGTKCMVNGECVMKNGEKMMMKDGECMDMKGNMDKCDMMHKTTKTDKKIAANYACPMHPEVTSDKPGKCSKCGMDLEKKK